MSATGSRSEYLMHRDYFPTERIVTNDGAPLPEGHAWKFQTRGRLMDAGYEQRWLCLGCGREAVKGRRSLTQFLSLEPRPWVVGQLRKSRGWE